MIPLLPPRARPRVDNTLNVPDNGPSLQNGGLLNLQDILRSTSEYNELSAGERKQLFLDARLCLHEVGPQVDDALDLVWLLCGLEVDEAAGWKVALYRQESPPHQNNPFLGTYENEYPGLPSSPAFSATK
jgi:hypothetical protein